MMVVEHHGYFPHHRHKITPCTPAGFVADALAVALGG